MTKINFKEYNLCVKKGDEKMKKKLNTDIKICPNCGLPVGELAAVCSFCGVVLPKTIKKTIPVESNPEEKVSKSVVDTPKNVVENTPEVEEKTKQLTPVTEVKKEVKTPVKKTPPRSGNVVVDGIIDPYDRMNLLDQRKPLSYYKKSSITLMPWLIVSVLLFFVFIIWAAPANSYTKSLKEDLKDSCTTDYGEYLNSKEYERTLDFYKELRPNVYNLIFGGERTVERWTASGYSECIIDYDFIVLSSFKWIFGLQIISILLAIMCIFVPLKGVRTCLIVFLGLTAFIFFATILNSFQVLDGVALVNDIKFTSKDIGLGLGCLGTMGLYVVALILSIQYLNQDN